MERPRPERLYIRIAYLGLAIVIAGYLLGAFVSRSLVALGFIGILILAVGWTTAFVTIRKRYSQPIGPALSSATLAPATPLAAPAVLPSLEETVTFDLSAEAARSRKQNQSTVRLLVGTGLFLVATALFLGYLGAIRADLLLLALAVLPGLIAIQGFVGARQVYSEPVAMRIGRDQIAFDLDPPRTVAWRWDSPAFGLKLRVTSAEVNRALDEPREGPTFRLLSGRGTGIGNGPQVVTEVPQVAFGLILRHAEAHGIFPLDRRLGVPGSRSDQRELTLSRATSPFTGSHSSGP